MSSQAARTDHTPIRRIAQACYPCRRKKARCSGTRPSCSSCRRLQLECVYPAVTPREPASVDGIDEGQPQPIQSKFDVIGSRLTSIENTLQRLGTTLLNIEQAVGQSTAHTTLLQRTSAPINVSDVDLVAPLVNLERDTNPVDTVNSPILEGLMVVPDVLTSVVDAYFTHCHNQSYSFFHEGNFRQRLSQGRLPQHLILAVMALAGRFSTHPYFAHSTKDTFVQYANRSWQAVVSSCFTANNTADIYVVQTLALQSFFDFTAGKSRHGSAWVKAGMAIRIAQDLRLMQEPPSHLSYADQEERRRAFWSIYLLDRFISCSRGRPLAIVEASCQLQLPSTEFAWRSSTFEKTLVLDDLANRNLARHGTQSPFAQVVLMAHLLGRITQYMLQGFNMRSPYHPWDPNSDFAEIESDLLYLEALLEMHKSIREAILQQSQPRPGTDIDQQTAKPIIFARAVFHVCYCILNHPFLLRRRIEARQATVPRSFLARALNSGWQHARSTMDLVYEAGDEGFLPTFPFYGYCVTIAGSIAALYVHCGIRSRENEALKILEDAIATSERLGKSWRSVSIMAQALHLLKDNTMAFSQLATEQSEIMALSTEDAEFMWSLVDYGTMSNEAIPGVMEAQADESNLWFDSWSDLFGNMEYMNTS